MWCLPYIRRQSLKYCHGFLCFEWQVFANFSVCRSSLFLSNFRTYCPDSVQNLASSVFLLPFLALKGHSIEQMKLSGKDLSQYGNKKLMDETEDFPKPYHTPPAAALRFVWNNSVETFILIAQKAQTISRSWVNCAEKRGQKLPITKEKLVQNWQVRTFHIRDFFWFCVNTFSSNKMDRTAVAFSCSVTHIVQMMELTGWNHTTILPWGNTWKIFKSISVDSCGAHISFIAKKKKKRVIYLSKVVHIVHKNGMPTKGEHWQMSPATPQKLAQKRETFALSNLPDNFAGLINHRSVAFFTTPSPLCTRNLFSDIFWKSCQLASCSLLYSISGPSTEWSHKYKMHLRA